MRITDALRQRALLEQLTQVRGRLDQRVREISTGRRVLRPSSDPIAAEQIHRIRQEVARVEAIRQGLVRGRARLDLADDALGSAVTLLTQARTIALQGGDPASELARDPLADQIDAYRDALLSVANTKVQGGYLFAGTATDTEPFLTDGTYQGNGDRIDILLDTGVVSTSVPGDAVFRGGPDALQAMSDLSAALRAGDFAGIASAGERLGEAVTHVSTQRGLLGTSMIEIDETEDRLSQRFVTLSQQATEAGAADLAASTSALLEARTSEEAILRTFNVVGRISLFDFLG